MLRFENSEVRKECQTIGLKAFYKCTSLKKVVIPRKVESIGKGAFFGCKNMTTVTIRTTKLNSKNTGVKVFRGIHANATINVPKKKRNAYQTLLKQKGTNKTVTIK